jgi:SAM-dependent methyltransferase
MTARNDQQKYDYICGLVEGTYPILAPVWQAARARFGAAWLREFIANIEAVYGTVDIGIEGRLGAALDGYAEFVNDSLRNQSFYEKHRRYKASSYAECVDVYYHNADHMMRCYLPGMYLSHLLWPQHYNMLCGFRENMLRRLERPKLFFEVGVGCGMYSKVLLEYFPEIRGIGFDISPYALEFTENLVGLFGHAGRYAIEQRDIRHGYEEQCDFLVCQEVLEHLENPAQFCGWLFEMIKPGGRAYITAALNAAHSDHIFHFRDPLQLEAMLRAAGFQPMSLQEEFAAGFKPREITPSLAGYLVERRA